MSSFAGKTVVVLGAARGIGAALCERLRAEDAAVIPVDREPINHPHALRLDLTDRAAVRTVVDTLPEAIDGLACVAGVPGTLDPATVMAVNFCGTRDFATACLPRMQRGGAAVFVASVTAHRCPWDTAALEALAVAPAPDTAHHLGGADGKAAYEISKRALIHWVMTRLPRFAERGVRANLVSPGPVQTAILADFESSIGKDRLDAAAALTGRHGEADEIAGALAFLLGPDAAWINGVELKVDGGYHALRAARDAALGQGE